MIVLEKSRASPTGGIAFRSIKKSKKFMALLAGFELARAEPNRFLIYLLNHSDTATFDVCRHTFLTPRTPNAFLYRQQYMHPDIPFQVPFLPMHSLILFEGLNIVTVGK